MTFPRALVLVALLSIGMSAGSAVAAQPSFDCAKAKSWAEVAVCNDEGLSALDRRVAELYRSNRAALTGEQQKSVILGQRKWLRERDNCRNYADGVACLTHAYNTRITQLGGTPASHASAGEAEGSGTVTKSENPANPVTASATTGTLSVGDRTVTYGSVAQGAPFAEFTFDTKGYRNSYSLNCATRQFLWTKNVRLSTGEVTSNTAGAEWRPISAKSSIANAVYQAACPGIVASGGGATKGGAGASMQSANKTSPGARATTAYEQWVKCRDNAVRSVRQIDVGVLGIDRLIDRKCGPAPVNETGTETGIGVRPDDLVRSKKWKRKFMQITGRQYHAFVERLGVASPTELRDGWILGQGALPHATPFDNAAFAINAATGKVYAAMVVGGKRIYGFGIGRSWGDAPPALQKYAQENGVRVPAPSQGQQVASGQISCGETKFQNLTANEGKALKYVLDGKQGLQGIACITELVATDKFPLRGQTVIKYLETVVFPNGYNTGCLNQKPQRSIQDGGFPGFFKQLECSQPGIPPARPGEVRKYTGEEII